MAEQDKKLKSEELSTSDTIQNIVKLQKKIYAACDDLDEHAEAIGESMFNAMLRHFDEQYLREFEITNAQKLLDVDKNIEELKIRRIKELAAISDEKTKLQNELDELREQQKREFELEKDKTIKEFEILRTKELGEIELEHQRVKAEISRRRQELETDAEVLMQTLERELSFKAETIIPGYKRRRRFFGIPIGKIQYNQAMNLVWESAKFSAYDYLTSRAQEIEDRKDKYFTKMGLITEESDEEPSEQPEEVSSEPLSKKDRKALLKQFKQLCRTGSAKTIISKMQTMLESIEEPAEQKFEPEPITERDMQYYLQELEEEDWQEVKAERRAEKAERRRQKKALKQLKKASKKEVEPPEVQSEPKEASASDVQVKIDVADNTE